MKARTAVTVWAIAVASVTALWFGFARAAGTLGDYSTIQRDSTGHRRLPHDATVAFTPGVMSVLHATAETTSLNVFYCAVGRVTKSGVVVERVVAVPFTGRKLCPEPQYIGGVGVLARPMPAVDYHSLERIWAVLASRADFVFLAVIDKTNLLTVVASDPPPFVAPDTVKHAV